MFTPNARGFWIKRQKKRSISGMELYDLPKPIMLGVVSLRPNVKQSPVRIDASASRGANEELMTDATFLIPARYPVQVSDIIQFGPTKIFIREVEPRISVLGVLDHFEVAGTIREQI